jgi:hypothetical protein
MIKTVVYIQYCFTHYLIISQQKYQIAHLTIWKMVKIKFLSHLEDKTWAKKQNLLQSLKMSDNVYIAGAPKNI